MSRLGRIVAVSRLRSMTMSVLVTRGSGLGRRRLFVGGKPLVEVLERFFLDFSNSGVDGVTDSEVRAMEAVGHENGLVFRAGNIDSLGREGCISPGILYKMSHG